MALAPLLSALMLAAAPGQEIDRTPDICAIFRMPEQPGHQEYGDQAAQQRARALSTRNWIDASVGPVEGQPYCRNLSGMEYLRFSPDGAYAEAYGGWQAGPLVGAWGFCFYEKVEGAWRTLACGITAVS